MTKPAKSSDTFRANVEHVAQFTGIAPDRVQVIHKRVDYVVEGIMKDVPKVRRVIFGSGRPNLAKGMEDVVTTLSAGRYWRDAAALGSLGDGPVREHLRARSEAKGMPSIQELVETGVSGFVVFTAAKARGAAQPKGSSCQT